MDSNKLLESNEKYELESRQSKSPTEVNPISTSSKPPDNNKTIQNRGVFKWLPVRCENDLVHGAWWYFWGSLFTVIIPIFPLIAIYEDWWPQPVGANGKPLLEDSPHVAAYSLIVFAGIMYTIGSYIFIDCFREGYHEMKMKHINMFECKNVFFRNDELIAIWFFILGTIPFIPCLILYVYYNPTNSEFKLALLCTILGVLAMFIYILAVAPERENTCIVATLKVVDPCLEIIRHKNPQDPDQVEIRICVPVCMYLCLYFL